MKAVILAGGLGSRLSEETYIKPKPMVEIGGRPMLWHIMKIYAAHGVSDFVICCGYLGHVIRQYFANYYMNAADVTFDLRQNRMEVHADRCEPWRVTLVDTGESSMTGGRLKRVRDHLKDGTFCFTYGDGVGDVDIRGLVDFHRAQGRLATVTATIAPGRFGVMALAAGGTQVEGFREKPQGDGLWVNGGFFVLEPAAIDYVKDDATVWEREPMERLVKEGQLAAFRHHGFWQPMDTLRDKTYLDDLWRSGKAPWKVW